MHTFIVSLTQYKPPGSQRIIFKVYCPTKINIMAILAILCNPGNPGNLAQSCAILRNPVQSHYSFNTSLSVLYPEALARRLTPDFRSTAWLSRS